MALAGRAAQCRQPRAAGAGRHSKSAWLAGWLLTGSPRRHGDKPGSVKSETSTSNQLSSSGNQTPCTIFGILGYPGISLAPGNRKSGRPWNNFSEKFIPGIFHTYSQLNISGLVYP